MLGESSDALSASEARVSQRPSHLGEHMCLVNLAHGATHHEAALMHSKNLCVKKKAFVFSI